MRFGGCCCSAGEGFVALHSYLHAPSSALSQSLTPGVIQVEILCGQWWWFHVVLPDCAANDTFTHISVD